jgi:mRNA-degrading endonuclease RelE of RelBE toxin-antitoxin system
MKVVLEKEAAKYLDRLDVPTRRRIKEGLENETRAAYFY